MYTEIPSVFILSMQTSIGPLKEIQALILSGTYQGEPCTLPSSCTKPQELIIYLM